MDFPKVNPHAIEENNFASYIVSSCSKFNIILVFIIQQPGYFNAKGVTARTGAWFTIQRGKTQKMITLSEIRTWIEALTEPKYAALYRKHVTRKVTRLLTLKHVYYKTTLV